MRPPSLLSIARLAVEVRRVAHWKAQVHAQAFPCRQAASGAAHLPPAAASGPHAVSCFGTRPNDPDSWCPACCWRPQYKITTTAHQQLTRKLDRALEERVHAHR